MECNFFLSSMSRDAHMYKHSWRFPIPYSGALIALGQPEYRLQRWRKLPRGLCCLMEQFSATHFFVFMENLCKYCVIPAILGALPKQRVLLAESLLLPLLNFVYFKGNLIWTLLIHLHLTHPRPVL